MKIEKPADAEFQEDRTNWRKVYVYVLIWLVVMCVLMVAFTDLTQ